MKKIKQLILVILAVISISSCASTYKIRYPQPILPVRPAITFIDCHMGGGKHVVLTDHDVKDLICLTPEDMQKLMWYVLSLEKEINKADATLKEINK